MCIGKIILVISILIQVIIYIGIVFSLNKMIGIYRLISISIPYGLFTYLYSKMWFNIINNMCYNGLDFDSIKILLAPLFYLLICVVCYYIGTIIDYLLSFTIGKKWSNIEDTNEFKEHINGDNFSLIEKDLLKKSILDKESDEKKKVSIDIFNNKEWNIKNNDSDPFMMEIIGIKRNINKYGLIIIENKITDGWNGYLKIVKFKNGITNNNKDNYMNNLLIDEQSVYKIEFKTNSDKNDIMNIIGKGNDRGIYLCDKNYSISRILLNLIILIAIILIFYLILRGY